MSRRKGPIGTPVQYPPGHPYNDPRRRAEDAVGMREAMRPRYSPTDPERAKDEKVRDFIAYMWAVEGRNLSNDEVRRFRDGLE